MGVDIRPQKNYPFQFVQADALTFDLSGFDMIAASPPCQRYTNAQRIQANEHPDLVAPIRDRLKASGVPWIIENVIGAPLCRPVLLCGEMFGLRTYRHRWFECSHPIEQPWHKPHLSPTRKMGRAPGPDDYMHVVGNFSDVKAASEAMGIDWMTRDELREAVPPAYTEYLGRAALSHCRDVIAA